MSLIALSGKIHSGKDTVAKMLQFFQLQKDYPSFWGNKTFHYFLSDEHTWESNLQTRYFSLGLKQIIESLTGISINDQNDAEIRKKKLGKDFVRYYYRHLTHKTIVSPFFHTEEELFNHGKDDWMLSTECEPLSEELTLRDLQKIVGTKFGRDCIHNQIWTNKTFADYVSDRYFQCKNCGTKYHQSLDFDEVRHDDCPKCNHFAPPVTIVSDYKKASHWILTDLRYVEQLRAVIKHDGILIRIERDAKLRQPDVTTLIEDESETALDDYDEWDYVIKNNKTIAHLLQEVKEVYEHINLPKLS